MIKIRTLPASLPIADTLAARTPHKQHWIGWLEEYGTGGYYHRSPETSRRADARYVYDHLKAAPMMIWLAEAAGVPEPIIRNAVKHQGLYTDKGARARAVRRVLPWSTVESYLL